MLVRNLLGRIHNKHVKHVFQGREMHVRGDFDDLAMYHFCVKKSHNPIYSMSYTASSLDKYASSFSQSEHDGGSDENSGNGQKCKSAKQISLLTISVVVNYLYSILLPGNLELIWAEQSKHQDSNVYPLFTCVRD